MSFKHFVDTPKAAIGNPKKPMAGSADPVHPLIELQRTIGNHAVVQLMASDGIRISRPDDRHELEAERIASRVMRMRDEDEHPQGNDAKTGRIDRPQGKEDPNDRVDRSAYGAGSTPDISRGAGLPRELRKLEGQGQQLPGSERSFFEPRFGVNFGAVRIHTKGEADQLSRSINARAFTIGNHIVFRSGEFRPGSHEGRNLLAHELTHTIQQGAVRRPDLSAGRGSIQRSPAVNEITQSQTDHTAGLVQRAVTNLAVGGAAAEAAAADHFVAARGGAPVVITATTSAPGQAVKWTGGTAQAGNGLQRTVTAGAARNVNITADTPADPGPQTVTVHVLNGAAAPANTPANLTFSRQAGNPAALAPFGLTDVRTNNPVSRIRAFLVGNQWVFRVQQLAHRYLLGITSGGRVDIRTAANATAANHCQVIPDLTPPPLGTAAGPPRTAFWSSVITLAHENAHVAHFYSPPFWEAFMRVAETNIEAGANNVNVDHTNPATMTDAAVVGAGAVANQAIVDAQHAAADAAEIGGSETFAHGQSNPMYTTLIAQIAAHFRPLAPTGLAAVALGAGAGVQLNWVHNACNETEYRVFRRRGKGAFARVATLPAGTITFTDNLAGMADGTDFAYFVTAAGVAGESNHSNQVPIHTP